MRNWILLLICLVITSCSKNNFTLTGKIIDTIGVDTSKLSVDIAGPYLKEGRVHSVKLNKNGEYYYKGYISKESDLVFLELGENIGKLKNADLFSNNIAIKKGSNVQSHSIYLSERFKLERNKNTIQWNYEIFKGVKYQIEISSDMEVINENLFSKKSYCVVNNIQSNMFDLSTLNLIEEVNKINHNMMEGNEINKKVYEPLDPQRKYYLKVNAYIWNEQLKIPLKVSESNCIEYII